MLTRFASSSRSASHSAKSRASSLFCSCRFWNAIPTHSCSFCKFLYSLRRSPEDCFYFPDFFFLLAGGCSKQEHFQLSPWQRPHLFSVEIDESVFGHKREYNRGQISQGKWVFGMVKRGTGRALAFQVPNRTRETRVAGLVQQFDEPFRDLC